MTDGIAKILVKAETKASSAPRGAGAEVEERLPKDPSEWSVGNVMQHIQRVDPSLGQYKDLFAQHVCFPPPLPISSQNHQQRNRLIP